MIIEIIKYIVPIFLIFYFFIKKNNKKITIEDEYQKNIMLKNNDCLIYGRVCYKNREEFDYAIKNFRDKLSKFITEYNLEQDENKILDSYVFEDKHKFLEEKNYTHLVLVTCKTFYSFFIWHASKMQYVVKDYQHFKSYWRLQIGPDF